MIESYRIKNIGFSLVHLPEKNIAMAQTQVTQELWEAIMGENPSRFKGAKHPVEQVSWEDSVQFANALSLKLGLTPAFEGLGNNVRFVEGSDGFRLPFEAEWEFVANEGQNFTYAGSDNLSEVGWFRYNSYGQTHAVATLKPNGYGVYDMSGNVWEWCLGDYENPGQYSPKAAQRVARGGSWVSSPQYCEVADRYSDSPNNRYDFLGLRLARSLN